MRVEGQGLPWLPLRGEMGSLRQRLQKLQHPCFQQIARFRSILFFFIKAVTYLYGRALSNLTEMRLAEWHKNYS